MVEQLFCKQLVVSSTLTGGSIKILMASQNEPQDHINEISPTGPVTESELGEFLDLSFKSFEPVRKWNMDLEEGDQGTITFSSRMLSALSAEPALMKFVKSKIDAFTAGFNDSAKFTEFAGFREQLESIFFEHELQHFAQIPERAKHSARLIMGLVADVPAVTVARIKSKELKVELGETDYLNTISNLAGLLVYDDTDLTPAEIFEISTAPDKMSAGDVDVAERAIVKMVEAKSWEEAEQARLKLAAKETYPFSYNL